MKMHGYHIHDNEIGNTFKKILEYEYLYHEPSWKNWRKNILISLETDIFSIKHINFYKNLIFDKP